jgi:hypothetical protein
MMFADGCRLLRFGVMPMQMRLALFDRNLPCSLGGVCDALRSLNLCLLCRVRSCILFSVASS